MTEPLLPPVIEDTKPHEPSHKDRILTKLSFVIIGFAVAFITTLAYWSFQPDRIASQDGMIISFVENEAYAGQVLKVKLTYCKEIDGPVQFTRSFISKSTEVNNPALTDVTGKGCIKDRIVDVPVPEQAATGSYRLKYHLTAQVNPLKTVNEDYYSEEIKIIGIADQQKSN